MVELYRFFLAGTVLAFVYAACLKWFGQWLLRKAGIAVGTRLRALSPMRRRLRIATMAAGVGGIVALLWGFVEPYYPVVERVRIHSDKVRRPVRIVQVSDLHSDPVVRAEKRVVRIVRTLAPDLIVFTGDGVNSDGGIPIFRETMRALSTVAPLFGVRGNWEAWWFTHVDTFENSGIKELNGDAQRVDVDGQTLWIGGVAVDNEQTMKSMLRKIPKNAFSIVLHHYPAASRLVDGEIDLLLSGDTHGGQIDLPLLGPLVRISRWDNNFYPSGLHQTKKGLRYYVNRGIGMEGGSVPRVRFNCSPEISLIEILPER